MSIYRFNPSQKEKSEVKLYSNIGTSEPFVARIWGLIDILNMTSYKNKKEINDSILELLFECLTPAYISLENIRKHKLLSEIAELDKQKDYFDLHNHLWAAYKDRMQIVFKDSKFDMGFLFGKDEIFNRGFEKFKLDFPQLGEIFFSSIFEDRKTWQKDMSMIRNNYIQHKKIDSEIAQKYFTAENAEVIFKNIWTAIEQMILSFLALELLPMVKIFEIPEDDRNSDMPKRYKLVPCDYLNMK